MSLLTTDIIFITSGIHIREAVDATDSHFKSFGLSLSYRDTYRLEDYIESDSPDCGEYPVETAEEAACFLERLKDHNAGGSVSYNDENTSLLVAFKSLDDRAICAVIIYVQANIFEAEMPFFKPLFKKIADSIKAVVVLKGSELSRGWDEEPLIEAALRGETAVYSDFVMDLKMRY